MSGVLRVGVVVWSAAMLTACGGGGSGASGQSAGTIGSASEDEAPVLFPPARPTVDPASSVAEIETRLRSVLLAYDELMIESIRQIDEIVRTIESGMNSSSDPDVLEQDTRLYDRIASERCSTERGPDGDLVAVVGCAPVPLAFRHPVYKDVLVYIDRYDSENGYRDFTGVDISSGVSDRGLPRTIELCTANAFCSGVTRDEADATRLQIRLDVPNGFIGEDDVCLLQFDPFELGTGLGDTNVNECAALLLDAMTVLDRLNDR